MESLEELKNLISEAKNIAIIPSQTFEPESLSGTLALFYTLKELNKNVNLIMPDVPLKYRFLVPPLDFIVQPKDFVISIPKNVANISKVSYEKNEENVKIHLTVEGGSIKKDAISFYFSDTKPDLIITLGIKNFRQELETKLDSFGFLLDSTIANIDTGLGNTRFGKINIVKELSLSEILFEITGALVPSTTNKNTANCLLTGLIARYENFQQPTPAHVFELCAKLMHQGANRQQIMENLYASDLVTHQQQLNIVTS